MGNNSHHGNVIGVDRDLVVAAEVVNLWKYLASPNLLQCPVYVAQDSSLVLLQHSAGGNFHMASKPLMILVPCEAVKLCFIKLYRWCSFPPFSGTIPWLCSTCLGESLSTGMDRWSLSGDEVAHTMLGSVVGRWRVVMSGTSAKRSTNWSPPEAMESRRRVSTVMLCKVMEVKLDGSIRWHQPG